MNKFLVVGGSLAQLPLVSSIKARGMEAFVIDGRNTCVAASVANHFVHCDFSDVAKSLNAVEGIDFSGIATCASDAGVPFIWSLKSAIGLCSPAEASAVVQITNKLSFREWQNSVNAPGKISLIDPKSLSFGEFNKVVFKRSLSSGSSGVKIVDWKKKKDIDDLNGFDFAEEYIEFDYEIGAQVVIDKKGNYTHFIHGDFVGGEHNNIPVGHYYPSLVTPNIEENVDKILAHLISKLALRQMWLNLDFGVAGDRVYLIEAGARLGATGLGRISTELFSQSWPDMLIDLELTGVIPKIKRDILSVCRAVLPSQPGAYKVLDDNENLEVLRHSGTFSGKISSGRDIMALLHKNFTSTKSFKLDIMSNKVTVNDKYFGRI